MYEMLAKKPVANKCDVVFTQYQRKIIFMAPLSGYICFIFSAPDDIAKTDEIKFVFIFFSFLSTIMFFRNMKRIEINERRAVIIFKRTMRKTRKNFVQKGQ
jgi:hypothetical protein